MINLEAYRDEMWGVERPFLALWLRVVAFGVAHFQGHDPREKASVCLCSPVWLHPVLGNGHACIHRCKPLRRAYARPSRLRHPPLHHQRTPNVQSAPNNNQSTPSSKRHQPAGEKRPCHQLRRQKQPSDKCSCARLRATCSTGKAGSKSSAKPSFPSGAAPSNGRSRRRSRRCRQRTPRCAQRPPRREDKGCQHGRVVRHGVLCTTRSPPPHVCTRPVGTRTSDLLASLKKKRDTLIKCHASHRGH